MPPSTAEVKLYVDRLPEIINEFGNIDRVLDMLRTSVNIFGDACCATIVARLTGEETTMALDADAAKQAA